MSENCLFQNAFSEFNNVNFQLHPRYLHSVYLDKHSLDMPCNLAYIELAYIKLTLGT